MQTQQQLTKQSSQNQDQLNQDSIMEDVQVDQVPPSKLIPPKTLSQSAQEFFNEDDENQRIIQFNQNQFDTDQQLSRTQNHGNIQGLNRQKIFPARDFSKAKRFSSLRSDQFVEGITLTRHDRLFLYQNGGMNSQRLEEKYKQNFSRSLLQTGIKEDSPLMFEGNNIMQDLPDSLQDKKFNFLYQNSQLICSKDEVAQPPLQQSIMNDSHNQDSIMYDFLQQYKNREYDLEKRLRSNSHVENSEQLNQRLQPILKIPKSRVNFSQNSAPQFNQKGNQLPQNQQQSDIDKSTNQGKSQIIKQPSNFQNCNVSNNSGTVIQVNVPKGTQAEQIIINIYGLQAQQISQANFAQGMQSQTQDQYCQRSFLSQVHQTKTPAFATQPQKQAGLPMPNVFMLTDDQVIARLIADIEIICDSKNSKNSDVMYFTLLKKLVRETVAFIQNEQYKQSFIFKLNQGVIQSSAKQKQNINYTIQNDDKYEEEKYIIFCFETFARIAHPRKSLFLIEEVLSSFKEKFNEVFIPSKHQLGQIANALHKFEKGAISEMTYENRKNMRACFEINERKIFDGQDLKLMQKAFQLTHKYFKKFNLKIVEI